MAVCPPQNAGRSRRPICGVRQARGTRGEGRRGVGVAVEQPVPVEDLHDAVRDGAVRQVQPVAQPDRLVQPGAARDGTARVRLDPGQAEVADVPRRRRVGEVEHLQDARRAPAVDGADQMRDARIAFPPVLVGVLSAGRRPAHLDHRPHERGVGRVGDVPDLVAAVAVGAQQVEASRLPPRELVAGAHLHHLRAAGPAGRGNVRQVDGRFRRSDVEHRRAVGLHGVPSAD